MVTLTLGSLYLALLLLKFALVRSEVRHQQREKPCARHTSPSTITIVQPILSGDPYLEAVLETNVLALKDAQFYWLLDTDDGEAHSVAQRIKGRHPQRTVCILNSSPAPDGINPKTFKLDLALAHVKTEIIVILDDDSRLCAGSLGSLTAALETADLSTALPFSRDDGRLAGRLLSQFVNNNSAMTYLSLLPFFAPVTINGMCYALRVGYLTRIGGFRPILRHLTDDLAMASMVIAAGGRIHQSLSPVEVQTSLGSLARYMRQMHRWFLFASLLMRRQPLTVNISIIVLHALPPLFLWGLMIQTALHPLPATLGAVAVLLVVRAILLVTLQRQLSGCARMAPLSSVASELLQPLHFLHALFQRTIQWRTRRFRVTDNDSFRSVP